ncbi:hypothetical protein ACOSQ2_017776 [Xanthoceras sorbifolium]
MVDSVVSHVMKRIGDYLIGEVVFLRGVEKEANWLKEELSTMHRFLKQAEEKQFEDPTLRNWVSDVGELAHDIEDVFDEFDLKVDVEASGDDGGAATETKPGYFCCFCTKTFDKGKKMVDLHNMGKEIEEFKKRIEDLSRRRHTYGIQDSGNRGEDQKNAFHRSRVGRRATNFAVEEKVVGFDDEARNLLAKLLDEDPRRFVISIFGMGGLGKTTIAKKLYHNNDVRMKFQNCCAWVTVSQDYSIRDLLLRIVKSFGFKTIKMEDLEKLDEEDLGRYLHRSLQGHTYLAVIDDVWDKEIWQTLKEILPDNENGSRVIITTRIEDVAKHSDKRTRAHQLRKLTREESWQLFCNKVDANFNEDEELKKLGEEMVGKCDGLPLAIVVLGGLLSTKEAHEWSTVHKNIWQHLRGGSTESIFSLSFDSLPYQLKQCFLYLCRFPEDVEISVEKLIYLLVAEGLIPQDEDHTMEEMAKDYLDGLIKRSLIQAGERYSWMIITYRVHDLLRDFAIEKARKLNFVYVYDEVKHSNTSSIISLCPRQAIYFGTEGSLWFQKCCQRLRSLLLFHPREHLVLMCSKFNSLRVLDVEFKKGCKTEPWRLVDEIGKLIHLRYLALRGKNIYLTSSILNLQRLQTLFVLRFDQSVRLSDEICKLKELRHLISLFSTNLSFPIDNLTNLQTLKFIRIECWHEIKTEKLVNLQELCLDGSFHVKVFPFDSIANLKSLRRLSVSLKKRTSFGSLQPLSYCLHLENLNLSGEIIELPKEIKGIFPNLEQLTLWRSNLKDDPMPLLGKLPKLITLELGPRFYCGKKLVYCSKSFPCLEILVFNYVDIYGEIEEWQVEERALPRLRGLRLPDDVKFTIPERLRSIPPPGQWQFSRGWPDIPKLFWYEEYSFL